MEQTYNEIIRAAFESSDPHAALCRGCAWANAQAARAGRANDWPAYRRWSDAWNLLYASAVAYDQGARRARAEVRAEAARGTVPYVK